MKNLKLTYLTLFPQLIENYFSDALLQKARGKGIIHLETINLRDYSDNKYKSVDDVPYGGGDGMLLRPEIAESAFQAVYGRPGYNKEKTCHIYLSPQGKPLTNDLLTELLKYEHIVMLCGRYGGVDQRVINKHVDLEISIGDYVLSGGELAALVITESLSRFLPGVLGDHSSAIEDSFVEGLLEAPQYTRPLVWSEQSVPAVLASGHHEKIRVWKDHLALFITWRKRPDLWTKKIEELKTIQVENSLKSFFDKHYAFLNSLSENDLLAAHLKNTDVEEYRLSLSKISL